MLRLHPSAQSPVWLTAQAAREDLREDPRRIRWREKLASANDMTLGVCQVTEPVGNVLAPSRN